jgi:tetratricopeptide (TPR) repeat protein
MAQTKIEELRYRLKSDPKSRLFFPLAEELRKATQLSEAEQVLRTGLVSHPAYLSAWVSLGRVLRDQGKHADAVEALTKALQIDPGNVVAARLLAESYLNLGEKVEAIKKYKLVSALLPADEEVEAIIQRLDTEINASSAPPPLALAEAEPEPLPEPEPEPEPAPAPAPAPEPEPEPISEPEPEPQPMHVEPMFIEPEPAPAAETAAAPLEAAETEPFAAAAPAEPVDDPFEVTYSRLKEGIQVAEATADIEPMSAAHDESPFEEPASDGGYSAAAFAIEQPEGMHIDPAPLAAEVPAPLEFEPAIEDADVFEEPEPGVAPGFIRGSFGANVAPPPPDADDFARTITMADLYANQGLIDEARDIYEDVLARDPDNAIVLAKMAALSGAPPAPAAFEDEPIAAEVRGTPLTHPAESRPNPKVQKLEAWLSRVTRKEAGRV